MKKHLLHNINKPGFKVPDNYFNNLEETLLSEIALKKSIPSTGFKTPDNYFENFKVHGIDTLSKKSNPKVISIFRKNPWLYVASAAALIVLLFNIATVNKPVNFASLDNESIENYILINDFETIELNNLIINPTAFENTILKEALSDASLEDYLYDNAELEDFNIE